MAQFVVFTLAAAMGSCGELAGHERRGSLDAPGRSQVLGLVAGALGVERDDARRLGELEAWKLTVGEVNLGPRLRDFQIAQGVHRSVKANTRREALLLGKEEGQINNHLSYRDYIQDPCFAVALWGGEGGEDIVAALKSPTFVPFFGRKSCPLSAPMQPRLVEAGGPVEALKMAEIPWWFRRQKIRRVQSDPHPTIRPDRIERRNDRLVDRAAWKFGSREVHILSSV